MSNLKPGSGVGGHPGDLLAFGLGGSAAEGTITLTVADGASLNVAGSPTLVLSVRPGVGQRRVYYTAPVPPAQVYLLSVQNCAHRNVADEPVLIQARRRRFVEEDFILLLAA